MGVKHYTFLLKGQCSFVFARDFEICITKRKKTRHKCAHQRLIQVLKQCLFSWIECIGLEHPKRKWSFCYQQKQNTPYTENDLAR